MNKKTIVAAAAIFIILGVSGYAMARPVSGGFWNGMMGSYGPGIHANYGGMMGGYGPGSGFWSGMMANYGNRINGNAYGTGCAMAGYPVGGYGEVESSSPMTIDEAKDALDEYVASTGNTDLEVSEVMEFSNNFYAAVKEESTGVHAFELLVDRYTGTITPEMGPNMMWNTKYGHMDPGTTTEASITEEQAIGYAQTYLDRALPGTKADEADAFYGYYTIHVLKDGNIYGMLSVNSYTGAVWYHNWHGTFVRMLEMD